MKIPRDVNGPRLVKALQVLEYAERQKGSHIRVTTQQDGENHEVVPNYDPIKLATLSGIRKRSANHHGLTVEDC